MPRPYFVLASSPSSDWRLWLGLVVFLLLFIGAAWFLRFFSARSVSGGAALRLRVLEQVSVSRDASVILLRAGSRVFLLGVSRSGVALLGEWPANEMIPADAERARPLVPAGLSRLFHRRQEEVGPSAPSVPSFDDALREAVRPEESAGHSAGEETVSSAGGEPSPEAQESGEAGGTSESRYSDALRRLDALGRWRSDSIPSLAERQRREQTGGLDDILDRVSQRGQRYESRRGRP